MSKRCPECRTVNADSAERCKTCNYPFVKSDDERNNSTEYVCIWRIRCPVDGRVLEASGPDYECGAECTHIYERIMLGATECKPHKETVDIHIPSEDEVDKPTLIMEEIESQMNREFIAEPSEPYKKIYIPIIIDNDCLIGRKGEVAVRHFCFDPKVSGEHCKILRTDKGWEVERKNGKDRYPTCVNGLQLTALGVSHKINDGDLLQIADKLFLITLRGMRFIKEN